jgi:hypothetical protein
MPFFSPPLEAKDAGLRVTEEALYRWTWPEIRKAVGVPEASVCSHPAIMPDFQTPSHTEFTPLFPRRCRFSRFVYPLAKEKSLHCFLHWIVDCPFDLFITNDGAIRPPPNEFEVFGEFHRDVFIL